MVDLEPWIVLIGEPLETSVAMWQLAGHETPALAIFSSETLARTYAAAYCQPPLEIRQLAERALIHLLVSCYQQGTQHAALDPDGCHARQMFVLRDVLAAARTALKSSRVAE